MTAHYRRYALLLGVLTVPVTAGAEETWWASAYLAATLPDSHLTGEASNTLRLSDGTGTQLGVGLARESLLRGHAYRLSAQAGNAAWDGADATMLVLGADYIWQDEESAGGGVYLGPRLGLMEFEDDLTHRSDSPAVYGYEFGFRQPFHAMTRSSAGTMAIGLFYQQLFTDARNRGQSASGVNLGVQLDRLDTLGIRLSWRL